MTPWRRSLTIFRFLMNPSSLRILAISSFSLDDGMSTFSSFALLALRMRVSISAIGSVIIGSNPSHLPTGLDDARDLAPERPVTETDAAHVELPEVAAGPAAQRAAVVRTDLELGCTLGLRDQRLLCHGSSSLLSERHAEVAEQCPALLVRRCRRDDRDVHSVDRVDLVDLDLREDHLLLDAQGVVAPAVEGLGRDSLEVPDAGQRRADEPVQELVHAFPP